MSGTNGTNGNGNGRRFGLPSAASTNDLMIFIVVVVLTIAFAIKFLFPGKVEVVDAQMFKEVLIFVLGAATGAKAMEKGVDKGTVAALSPPPPPAAPKPEEPKP